MYALIIQDSRSRRELLKLPLFASAMDAKRFAQGFRSAVGSDSEMPEDNDPPMFHRGVQFAFLWMIYARQWTLDETPMVMFVNA